MITDPLVFSLPSTPHVLTLSAWMSDDYLGEDFGYWDEVDITCPHEPPTEHMPCAIWDLCGCPGNLAEMSSFDGGAGTGEGPCPTSAIGRHHYHEGKPHRPLPVCFARDWADDVGDTALEMGLRAGAYLVSPWWDDGSIRLDLIDPLVVVNR